ncbi:hypothetical protein SprV_0100153100 [Sparganum proliferum]
MKELRLREQRCLRSANQENCSSSQRRRQYPTHREHTNSPAMDRTFQRRPPSQTLPSPACLKWRPTPTSISRSLSTKPSGPCSSSPAGKRPDRTRFLLGSTSTVAPTHGSSDGALPGGNHQLCDDHRGISLVNIAGKIFARILLNRLNHNLKQGLLPENQCGFRGHPRTTDIIFAVHQLRKKCQEMRSHPYSTFANLTKHPQCRHIKDMQKNMNLFAAASANFGLILNTEKTVVMHQPPPDTAYIAPQINVNGTQLQVVHTFTYLGRTLFRTLFRHLLSQYQGRR